MCVKRSAPALSSKGCSGKGLPGDNSGGAPPLPIPNREVKPARADGTAHVWESRSLPVFLQGNHPRMVPFFLSLSAVDVPIICSGHIKAVPQNRPLSFFLLIHAIFFSPFANHIPICYIFASFNRVIVGIGMYL